MILVHHVFAWERKVADALWVRPDPRWLGLFNFLLADFTWVLCAVVPMLLLWYGGSFLFLVPTVGLAPKVQAWLTWNRGRPRDPQQLVEYGAPSLDCMITTIWTVPLLGPYAAIPILATALLRMIRGAHWPLDTLVGVLLGLMLSIPTTLAIWLLAFLMEHSSSPWRTSPRG